MNMRDKILQALEEPGEFFRELGKVVNSGSDPVHLTAEQFKRMWLSTPQEQDVAADKVIKQVVETPFEVVLNEILKGHNFV